MPGEIERAGGEAIPVILVTDADQTARAALEQAARQLDLGCVAHGEHTPGVEGLVQAVHQSRQRPVLVLFDDRGHSGPGAGEQALRAFCHHPYVRVLGALAVASHTDVQKGAWVDASVTRSGKVVAGPVDKLGRPRPDEPLLTGDTAELLRGLPVPIVVGVGDPGKMQGADAPERGAPVTTRAIQELLQRAGQDSRGPL